MSEGKEATVDSEDEGRRLAKRVIVTRSPSLDAVCSLVAAGAEPQDIMFLPATSTEVMANWPGALVLDHPSTREPVATGAPRSTLARLLAALPQEWPPEILAEVERAVRGGTADPWLTLDGVLEAVRWALIDEGKTGRGLDLGVVRVVGAVIRGLVLIHLADQEAERALADVEVQQTSEGWLYMILPMNARLPRAGIVLAKRGIVASIFSTQGIGLGVTRHRGFTQPDFRRLADALPGWYVGAHGELACWGSSKAPEAGPPPAGTPQTPAELAKLVDEVFGRGSDRG